MLARDNTPRILIVTPARNEAQTIPHTIESMIAQTVRPTVWTIVDDGSTDDTAAIVARAAAEHTWITLVQRTDRGQRSVGPGVIEAFCAGLDRHDLDSFDYVCKLDGDLQFGPTYFERLLEKFDADPRLGTASGKCFDKTAAGFEELRTNDDFSLGACKFYRVPCFRDIGGFVRQVMWDGIDCHRCRMKGWKAASYRDDALKLYELRPMGTSDRSVFHGRFRWGRGQYFMGTHWLYAFAIAAYRTFERPFGIGGLCILAGYFAGMFRRDARYDDPEFRRYLRRWQLSRLRLIS